MDSGAWEWAARWSAWPAVALGLWATRSARPAPWWRVGWLALLLHEAAAFWLVHDGSHGRAVADTARQVAAVTGREFGGALYANHVFTVAWTVVALMGSRCPSGGLRVWSAVFLFFAFNGAVVFARGWGRLLGLALFGAWLAHRLWARRVARPRRPADPGPSA